MITLGKRQEILPSCGKTSDVTIKHYMHFHRKPVHNRSCTPATICFYFLCCSLYQRSSATLELRNSLFLVSLCTSVHFQSYVIVFLFPLGKRICTRYTKKQSGQTGPVHQPHPLHRSLGESPHLLVPLCIHIFRRVIFIKHISVTLQVDNALRHRV